MKVTAGALLESLGPAALALHAERWARPGPRRPGRGPGPGPGALASLTASSTLLTICETRPNRRGLGKVFPMPGKPAKP